MILGGVVTWPTTRMKANEGDNMMESSSLVKRYGRIGGVVALYW